MSETGKFENKCVKCGKILYTYAIDRQGTLPKVYCGKVCEANAKYEKRFDKRFE